MRIHLHYKEQGRKQQGILLTEKHTISKGTESSKYEGAKGSSCSQISLECFLSFGSFILRIIWTFITQSSCFFQECSSLRSRNLSTYIAPLAILSKRLTNRNVFILTIPGQKENVLVSILQIEENDKEIQGLQTVFGGPGLRHLGLPAFPLLQKLFPVFLTRW